MTLDDFKHLNQEEQIVASIDYGEYIAARTMASYKIMLWIVNDFYVEFFYDKTDNKIQKIRSFKNPDLLSAFLEQIDISPVFK